MLLVARPPYWYVADGQLETREWSRVVENIPQVSWVWSIVRVSISHLCTKTHEDVQEPSRFSDRASKPESLSKGSNTYFLECLCQLVLVEDIVRLAFHQHTRASEDRFFLYFLDAQPDSL